MKVWIKVLWLEKGNIPALLFFFFKPHSKAVKDSLAKGCECAFGASQFGALTFPSFIQIVLQAVTSACCALHSASPSSLPAKVILIFLDSVLNLPWPPYIPRAPECPPLWQNPILRLTTIHFALELFVCVCPCLSLKCVLPQVGAKLFFSYLSLTPSSCSINVYYWVKFDWTHLFQKKKNKPRSRCYQ